VAPFSDLDPTGGGGPRAGRPDHPVPRHQKRPI